MATYVVGDIQGCLASLQALLARVGFGGTDRLWCVGDLVNRGPDSLGTLRFARSLGERFATALGNHDLHFLAMVHGSHPHRPGDTLQALLDAPDRDELATWLRQQPLLLETQDWLVVHAGVPPFWNLATVRARARELEAAVRGTEHPAFFQAMYGDEPAHWDDALTGMARLRAITNHLTRMRLVAGDGVMEFTHKGGLAKTPPGYKPWFAYPSQLPGKIAFGHWAALRGLEPEQCHPRTRAWGLDTGCVWGRRLTALRLDDERLFSVPAAEPRAREAKATGRQRHNARDAAPEARLNNATAPPHGLRSQQPSGKTYLVGGAVRDGMLGLPVRERDWVVVGATVAEMLAHGYKQVGRDFPVFLDPRSGEQHALARTERRTGPRHTDFACHAEPSVTLEDDLLRRDLTINAMAKDGDRLIDPHGGKADLNAQVLRHVSPAFAEDPLRVFRVARFAAQLPSFRVADETLALMTSMRRELAALSGERVWGELAKAAVCPAPSRFFDIARALDGAVWFERLNLEATVALFRRQAFRNQANALVAIGWTNDRAAIANTFSRLKAPRLLTRAAICVAAHGTTLADAKAAPALLEALTAIDAFRPGTLAGLALAAVEDCAGVSLDHLRDLIEALRGVRVDAVPGPAYGVALRQARLARIASWHQSA